MAEPSQPAAGAGRGDERRRPSVPQSFQTRLTFAFTGIVALTLVLVAPGGGGRRAGGGVAARRLLPAAGGAAAPDPRRGDRAAPRALHRQRGPDGKARRPR